MVTDCFLHTSSCMLNMWLTDLYSTVVTKPSRGGIYCTTGFVWVASKLLCFLAAFQVMLKIADQKSTRLFTSKIRPAVKMLSNFCWARVTVWELDHSCSLLQSVLYFRRSSSCTAVPIGSRRGQQGPQRASPWWDYIWAHLQKPLYQHHLLLANCKQFQS